jgi:hypothetical protein
MIIVSESAAALKGYLQQLPLRPKAGRMVLRMVLAFLTHRGRMSCSQAAGSVASEPVHRGELTRFLARKRWRQIDFNAPLRQGLLQRESRRGRFAPVWERDGYAPGRLRQETPRYIRLENIAWHVRY